MKTKNMKLRSSRMREINSNSLPSDTNKIQPAPPKCSYVSCNKGPNLTVMTLSQFPIDSATFTITDDYQYQYQIKYKFNNNINDDSFTIIGPFQPSIISNINNYELRQQNYENNMMNEMNKCKCSSSFHLRNISEKKDEEGFMLGLETLLNNANNGGLIGIQSQIILPVSFIVFNQQGLYYYLNVDKNSNVTFSSTSS